MFGPLKTKAQQWRSLSPMLLCSGYSVWALPNETQSPPVQWESGPATLKWADVDWAAPCVWNWSCSTPGTFSTHLCNLCIISYLMEGFGKHPTFPAKLTNMQTTSWQLFNTSPLQAAPSNVLFHLKETPFPQLLVDTPWNLIAAKRKEYKKCK